MISIYYKERIKEEYQGDCGLMIAQDANNKKYQVFLSTPQKPFEIPYNNLSNLNMDLVKIFHGIDYSIATKLEREILLKPKEYQMESLEVLLLKPKKTKLRFFRN